MSPSIVVPPSKEVIFPEGNIHVPYGRTDTVSCFIGNGFGAEKDFTTYVFDWDYSEELDRLPTIKVRLLGVSSSDLSTYIKKRYRLKFFAENYCIGAFRIENIETSDGFTTTITAVGYGTTLEDAITDQSTYVYHNAASNTIIDAIVTEMTVQTNENFGNVNGSWSWDNKLSTCNDIAEYFRADWWIDQVHPYDTDRFNISKRRGRVPIIKNFYDATSNDNTMSITKEVDVENHLNDIILQGERNFGIRFLETFTNENLTPPPSPGVSYVVQEHIKEANKIIVYISADETPQECYITVYDENDNYSYLQELNVVGGRDVFQIIDVSNVDIAGEYRRPYRVDVTFHSHASNPTDLKIKLGVQIQLTTQFSAVNNRYTKIEADLSEPEEGVPFDISCQDSVWFPIKGIIHIGSDVIGYRNNEGNVLSNCTSDADTGHTNPHRAGILIFPTYDGSGKNDTFIVSPLTINGVTVTVQDTSGFPSSGSIIISDEVLTYTSKTPTTFVGASIEACRNQTGTQGGAKPHSKYTRVFEYDSTKHYIPSSPKTGSQIKSEELKSRKYFDSNLDDIQTAETYASSILESNMDVNVIKEGGLVTATVWSADSLGDLANVHIGDTVYIKSTESDVDGNYEVIAIKWSWEEEHGEQCLFLCGNRRYRFIEDIVSKWRILYG